MIKFKVVNMSCGHCQLKINAELNSRGYKVIKIDMMKNTVTIDAKESDYKKVIKVLDNINYLVEEDVSPDVITEYKFWNDSLFDDNQYNKAIEFITELGVEVTGFDEDTCKLILMCSKKEYESIVSYTEELNT